MAEDLSVRGQKGGWPTPGWPVAVFRVGLTRADTRALMASFDSMRAVRLLAQAMLSQRDESVVNIAYFRSWSWRIACRACIAMA